MSEPGSTDDTWEEDDPRRAGGRATTPDATALAAAKAWLARATVRRLQIHLQAADVALAERQMAFAAMADELQHALAHLRVVLDLADRLKVENTVFRRAAGTRSATDAPDPAP